MNTDLQKIILSKAAERRRLRDLPWLEKLEMLDKLRDRHLWLRNVRQAGQGSAQASLSKSRAISRPSRG